jgi:hypothetical protein
VSRYLVWKTNGALSQEAMLKLVFEEESKRQNIPCKKKKKYAQKHCGRVRRRDQKKAEIENTRRKKMMGGEVGSTKDLVGNAHH